MCVSSQYSMEAQLLPEAPKEASEIRQQELHDKEMQNPVSACASPVLVQFADCLRQ